MIANLRQDASSKVDRPRCLVTEIRLPLSFHEDFPTQDLQVIHRQRCAPSESNNFSTCRMYWM